MADAPNLGLEQCTEIMKEHGGKMTTALATLLLACQLQVANAQSVPRVVGPGEHHTDIIGAGELPKKNIIVLPGGTATTEKGQWTVTTSVSPSATLQATGIASNGMKFTDMEKMSADEMNKLNPKIQEELEAWMEKELQQGKQAVVSKTNEGKQLDQVVVSLDTANEGKKQALIRQQLATLDQFIGLINKGGTNTVIYKQLKEDFKQIILSKKPPEVVERINNTPGLAERILQS